MTVKWRHPPLPRGRWPAAPLATPPAPQARRRTVLALGTLGTLFGGWMSPALAQQAAVSPPLQPATEEGPEPPRLALLIGNRFYPDGEDLPPIHKNVRDLRAALEKRGFTVTEGLDLDPAAQRALLERFIATVQAAPPESTVLFYFAGHGAQVDAENLLIAANLSPKSRADVLLKGSLQLTHDIVRPMPRRLAGLTIAVVDACRTSLKSALEGGGLNQVEAAPGCLIAFSTAAGRPAIAPATETASTFYTASLVKLLNTSSDEITFSDLFRLVKTDVQQTMQNHPVAVLRQFAQFPFIAENTQVRRRLAPRVTVAAAPPPAEGAAAPPPAPAAPPPRFRDGDEAADWDRLEGAMWPADVMRLAAEFLQRYPQSRLLGSAQVAHDGARDAAQILRRNDVRLYRSSFQPGTLGRDQLLDIFKAARGDKDAAARMGRFYGDGPRYEGWLQFAAALGNGIAAYELALYYRRNGQPLPAAQFEARAQELGYTPPPSLDNTRK